MNAAPSAIRSPHLAIDANEFASRFNRQPFYIQHDLAGHPLLELPAMAALSERLPARLVEWNAGHAGAYGQPDKIKPSATGSCREAILGVAERPTWVLLRLIENDPLYKHLLDELLDEIEVHSERSHPGMCQREGFLFISSQAAVTPYHFDPEFNFLLQVRGNKTVHMWDPDNRAVLPAAAVDSFYANIGDNRNQPYRDEFLNSAWVLPLPAGRGLHFPLHAPHWVKTESDVSVSLSITFRTRRSKVQEDVHSANHHLRRWGLNPPAPGTSRLWDASSRFTFRALRRTGTLLRLRQAR